ncbi:MAG: zinc-binding dehydrogenase [Actinomycetia bacterium]|nr:zinc-binding dehydrogenase [Actinomycetes bacterium]
MQRADWGGAVLNALCPEAGASIAIFGTGAVGLCAVMAAAIVGCLPIIAVDRRPDRLALAAELGADETIHAQDSDPVEAVRRMCPGGAQYSLDATGDPAAFRQAVDFLRETGLCGLVGAAPYGAEARLDMTTILRGRSVRGVTEGDVDPDRLIPPAARALCGWPLAV